MVDSQSMLILIIEEFLVGKMVLKHSF